MRIVFDAYLLTLSDAVRADYLITGDADLMAVGQHNQTRIVDVGHVLIL